MFFFHERYWPGQYPQDGTIQGAGRAWCPRPHPPGQGRRPRSFATVQPRGDADVEMSRARCLGPDAIQAPPTPGWPVASATVC